MKRKQADDFLIGAAKRAAKGLAPGEQAQLDARLRWVCPNGVCRNETTYPHDDARLYSYLPRAGNHPLRYEREALLIRRNAIEAVFHMLKHYGLGGDDNRPAWATDDEMDWLLSLSLLGITARRHAIYGDAYDQAFDEATRFGLLAQPTVQRPTPGPDSEDVRRAIAERMSDPDRVLAPRTWQATVAPLVAAIAADDAPFARGPAALGAD